MSLTYKDISEILKIIDASDCEELVLEIGDTKLVVQRNGGGSRSSEALASAPAPQPAVQTETPAPAPAEPATTAAATIKGGEGATEIRAPMVGTFYRKPSPADPNFVAVGHAVTTGDPLCLIEVMKLYTTMEAPADGVVSAIGANDAELVAHNQVLFVIDPA